MNVEVKRVYEPMARGDGLRASASAMTFRELVRLARTGQRVEPEAV
jgi:hypothetical protein